MIKKIKSTFECHDGSTVELADGFTALCGASDSGKSAMNRSIALTATNTPRGESYMPWSGKATDVEVTTDTGDTVSRIRTSSENKYVVKGTDLKALGTSVPDEVTDILGINELNIQKQIQPYYVLQKSPGEVAKMINDVAGISDADKAIKKTNEMLRITNKDKKEAEADAKTKQAVIDGLGWVEAAKEASDHLTGWANALGGYEILKADLSAMEDQLETAMKILADMVAFEVVEKLVADMSEAGKYTEGIGKSFTLSSELVTQLESIELDKYEFLEKLSVAGILKDEGELELMKRNHIQAVNIALQLEETKDYSVLDEVDLADMKETVADMEAMVAKDAALEAALGSVTSAMKIIADNEKLIAEAEEKLNAIPRCDKCGGIMGECGDD